MFPPHPTPPVNDPLLAPINGEELEPQKPPLSKLKRLIVILIALLIIILFLSTILITSPIGKILEGKIESQQIQNNLLIFGNITLKFSPQAKNQLDQLYHQEQKVEFSLCLQGTKDQNTYHITSIYQPKIFEQTFNHVTFEPCSQDTLILFHTHPYKSCLASETDIKTLKRTKNTNPNILMIIMCEPERFSVYG